MEEFHNKGYYQINKLVDEDLTVSHIVEIIDDLKEGTARVIKKGCWMRLKRSIRGRTKSIVI